MRFPTAQLGRVSIAGLGLTLQAAAQHVRLAPGLPPETIRIAVRPRAVYDAGHIAGPLHRGADDPIDLDTPGGGGVAVAAAS